MTIAITLSSGEQHSGTFAASPAETEGCLSPFRKKCKITEYPELEGTCENHLVQPLDLHRAP